MTILDWMPKLFAISAGSEWGDPGPNRTGPLEALTVRSTSAAIGSMGTSTPTPKRAGKSGRVRSIFVPNDAASGTQGYTSHARSQSKIDSAASSTSLFLRSLALCHIHRGAHELDEIAGSAAYRMADDVEAFHRSVRKNDAVVHRIVRPLTSRLRNDVVVPPSILRMNALQEVVPWRSVTLGIEAKQAGVLVGGVGVLVGGHVPRPATRMAEPLGFGQIRLTPPQGLFGPLTIGDVLDVGHEPCRPSSLIGEGCARHGGVEFRPVFPHDPDLETRESLAAIDLCHERRPARLGTLRQRKPVSDDLIGRPAHKALECRVAALDRLVPSEEHDSDGRGVEDRLQLGAGLPPFTRPFGHLHLELVMRKAELCLGVATPLPDLEEELVGRNEERILLKKN